MTTLSPAPKTTSPASLALSPVPIAGLANTRHEVLVALAPAGDRGLSPRELVTMTGRSPSAVRELVGRLVTAGLVTRKGKRGALYITPAGAAEAGAVTAPVGPGPSAAALDSALSLLPAEGLRALTRLLLSVTVGRHHLRQVRPSGWLSGVACGPTTTGKTLAGLIVCHTFGLNSAVHVRLAAAETERSLWGRREQAPGGTWVLRPAAPLGSPFLVLDELDKAPAELRQALSKLLQGDTRVAGEGSEVVEVAPAVLVTTNGRPESIREEYRRRAMVLDTKPLVPLLGDIDLTARRVLAPGILPHFDLARLGPPADALSDEDVAYLRKIARWVLTDDGWRQADMRGLELAALGRAALWGWAPEDAVNVTIADYATCAVTTGDVVPDRLGDLRRLLAESGVTPEAMEAAEAERAALEARRHDAARQEERASRQVTGARAALAYRLEEVERSLGNVKRGSSTKALATGLSHQLSALRRDVLAARSESRLGELAQDGEELLGQAAGALDRASREQEAVERQRAAERAKETVELGNAKRWKALAAGRRPPDAHAGEKPIEYLVRLGVVALHHQEHPHESRLETAARRGLGLPLPTQRYYYCPSLSDMGLYREEDLTAWSGIALVEIGLAASEQGALVREAPQLAMPPATPQATVPVYPLAPGKPLSRWK